MKTTNDPVESITHRKARCAFTLIELIVLLTVLSLLAVTALPAIAGAKYKTRTARCSSNMRLWGAATSMYLGDNKDCLPYFALGGAEIASKSWMDALAPYVARAADAGTWFSTQSNPYNYNLSAIATNEVRQCPAGNVTSSGSWDTWIGANFGAYGNSPLSGPFYYGDYNPPLSITRIRKPADALGFMDAFSTFVYSPVDANYRFAVDYDGDGIPDTMPQYPSVPYNFARPKVHENGANATLLDGHVERVPYKLLWSATFSGAVKHSFWYLED